MNINLQYKIVVNIDNFIQIYNRYINDTENIITQHPIEDRFSFIKDRIVDSIRFGIY